MFYISSGGLLSGIPLVEVYQEGSCYLVRGEERIRLLIVFHVCIKSQWRIMLMSSKSVVNVIIFLTADDV